MRAAATAAAPPAASALSSLAPTSSTDGFLAHPATADAGLHLSLAGAQAGAPLRIPAGVEGVVVGGDAAAAWAAVRVVETAASTGGTGDALLDADGGLAVRGLRAKAAVATMEAPPPVAAALPVAVAMVYDTAALVSSHLEAAGGERTASTPRLRTVRAGRGAESVASASAVLAALQRATDGSTDTFGLHRHPRRRRPGACGGGRSSRHPGQACGRRRLYTGCRPVHVRHGGRRRVRRLHHRAHGGHADPDPPPPPRHARTRHPPGAPPSRVAGRPGPRPRPGPGRPARARHRPSGCARGRPQLPGRPQHARYVPGWRPGAARRGRGGRGDGRGGRRGGPAAGGRPRLWPGPGLPGPRRRRARRPGRPLPAGADPHPGRHPAHRSRHRAGLLRRGVRGGGAAPPGSRVLVHAAAGAVGLAGLDVVTRAAGAAALATAGSPPRRRAARAACAVGAASSRDTTFADAFGPPYAPAAAAGRGPVDALINSLTSPGMVAASLACLAGGGRFTEIAKRGVWSPARAAQERPDVAFAVIAIDLLPRPALRAALARVSALAQTGAARPLPATTYPLSRTRAAMWAMAHTPAVGKVVLEVGPGGGGPAGQLAASPSPGAAWVITGGLGALGGHVASWLAGTAGAARIVLAGRSGRGASSLLALAATDGCLASVTAVQCDSAAAADTAGLVGSLTRAVGAPGIAGLVLSGGVLADAGLAAQSPAHLRACYAPKLATAAALSRALGAEPLAAAAGGAPALLAFTSSAAVLGSPGQAAYAAANAALDGWVARQADAGTAALSIQWGGWGRGRHGVRRGDRRPHEADRPRAHRPAPGPGRAGGAARGGQCVQ